MHCHAAEELSALGADVNVTLSQHRMELWVTVDTYYKLAQGRLRSFWEAKMDNLGLLRLTPEANQDSLFGLIHLAVRHRITDHHAGPPRVLRPF